MPANLAPNSESIDGRDEVVKPAAQTSETGDNDDRRRAKRFAYPVVQLMAQYDRNGLPARDQFRQVQCRDVSSSGISFLWPRIPDFEYVVIALDTNGPPIHVTARVASVRPAPERPGQLLIGCQFTGRLDTY
jgi:hypothetical protein